jgi:hypothetical protein
VIEPDGSSHPAILRDVDIIHVGMPAIKAPLPPEIAEAFEAMHVIERYRDPCTRGDHPIDIDVIKTCSAAYDRCVAAAFRAVAPSHKVVS